MRIAFIPARAGSKGIKNKNMINIAGKPLVQHSIDFALRSKCFDQVVVSTDGLEIADFSKSCGAEVPYIRPEEISGDKSTTESAITFHLTWASENSRQIDEVYLLQPTSPLRAMETLTKVKEMMTTFDSVLTVNESHRFIWKRSKEGAVPGYNYLNRPRRQDMLIDDIVFFENGSIYAFKTKPYLEVLNRICGKYDFCVSKDFEQFEIDDPFDLKLLEFYMEQFNEF